MDCVTPERMKTVAAIFRDPTALHWDREATRAIGFEGKLLNQSPINLGYVRRDRRLLGWPRRRPVAGRRRGNRRVRGLARPAGRRPQRGRPRVGRASRRARLTP
jgi:hypothetical protein